MSKCVRRDCPREAINASRCHQHLRDFEAPYEATTAEAMMMFTAELQRLVEVLERFNARLADEDRK